jgi:hypothetical protein
VVDALPLHIQEALPAVLRALTTVRLGEDAVTAAPALRVERSARSCGQIQNRSLAARASFLGRPLCLQGAIFSRVRSGTSSRGSPVS